MTGLLIFAYYPGLANIQQQQKKDYLLRLLREGKVDEFNEIRRKDNYSRLDLCQADLVGRVLSHADLRNSNLNLANLGDAKLYRVVFAEASLLHANLSGADLSHADLSHADLSDVGLSYANLSYANLSYANLSNAYLVGADLSNSNLESSIIIGGVCLVWEHSDPYPQCKDANFNNAIIDQAYLSEYFQGNNGKNVPLAVRDKKELAQKLEGRGFDREAVKRYLSFSYLPDTLTQ